nr:hypothetical protein KPHV_06060 [Kitasatospora purpeofusca]
MRVQPFALRPEQDRVLDRFTGYGVGDAVRVSNSTVPPAERRRSSCPRAGQSRPYRTHTRSFYGAVRERPLS